MSDHEPPYLALFCWHISKLISFTAQLFWARPSQDKVAIGTKKFSSTCFQPGKSRLELQCFSFSALLCLEKHYNSNYRSGYVSLLIASCLHA